MRKVIKNIIFWVYAIVAQDKAPKIVFYHDIGKKWTPMGTSPQMFFKHMRVIVESCGQKVESCKLNVEGCGGEDVESCKLKVEGCRRDVICFDDGFRGVWDYRDEVKSISVKCKVKVFVAPRLVGQLGYLTWDEIRTLNREYGIDFQCHTWSHQTLVGEMIDESPKEERTEEWYKRELVESREKIAMELGKEVDELCFPVGNFSDDVIRRCKEAGYKRVYASYPGNITDDYIQPRCLVQDLGVVGFRAVLNGGMNPLAKRYRAMHCKVEC